MPCTKAYKEHIQRRTGKSFSFTFSGITHNRKSGKCTDAAGVRPGIKSAGLCGSCKGKWRCFHMENPNLLPYETKERPINMAALLYKGL